AVALDVLIFRSSSHFLPGGWLRIGTNESGAADLSLNAELGLGPYHAAPTARMDSLSVSSKIGRLKCVLVHPPGPELSAVTPTNRADYLYDDIIALEIAQREHRRFVSVLQRFAE